MVSLLLLVVIRPPFLGGEGGVREVGSSQEKPGSSGGLLHLPANRFEPGITKEKKPKKQNCALWDPGVRAGGLEGPLPGAAEGRSLDMWPRLSPPRPAPPLPSPARCGAGAQRARRGAALGPRAGYPGQPVDRSVQVRPYLGGRARRAGGRGGSRGPDRER